MRKFSTLIAVIALPVLAGCSTDIGSLSDSQPAQPQIASNPNTTQPVPYGQPAPQNLANAQVPSQQVPPSGQVAFAPAPKPGGAGVATNAVNPALTPAPAQAGIRLTEQELRQLLTGRSIQVADGRRLEFGRAGSYQETRNGQAIAVGRYQIRDVSVCVQFTTGLTRCDSFVRNGNQLFVEDRNGQRLPAQAG